MIGGGIIQQEGGTSTTFPTVLVAITSCFVRATFSSTAEEVGGALCPRPGLVIVITVFSRPGWPGRTTYMHVCVRGVSVYLTVQTFVLG